MKLFDSHAHLDDERFNEDREVLISQIHEEIEGFVSAGYSLEGSKKAVELSKKYSDEAVTKMINGVLDNIYHNEDLDER